MENLIDSYLENYPVYKILCQKINTEILNNPSTKIIQVEKGNTIFTNQIFGRLSLIENNCSEVIITYFLYSSKYKEELKKELFKVYSEYIGVEIIEEPIKTTIINTIKKSCNLLVKIPCNLNRKYYLKADVSERQKLREEAATNIKNSLVILKENIEEHQKR